MRDDSLDGARGCIFALLFSIPLWCMLAGFVALVVARW